MVSLSNGEPNVIRLLKNVNPTKHLYLKDDFILNLNGKNIDMTKTSSFQVSEGVNAVFTDIYNTGKISRTYSANESATFNTETEKYTINVPFLRR